MCLSPEYLCQSWEVVEKSFSLEPQNGLWAVHPSHAHSQTPGVQTNPQQDGAGPNANPQKFFLQPELSCFLSERLGLRFQEVTSSDQETKKVAFEGTRHTPSSLS